MTHEGAPAVFVIHEVAAVRATIQEARDAAMVWFAKTLADFEINDLAALPALFCYNS
jgi:hypothetical protein